MANKLNCLSVLLRTSQVVFIRFENLRSKVNKQQLKLEKKWGHIRYKNGSLSKWGQTTTHHILVLYPSVCCEVKICTQLPSSIEPKCHCSWHCVSHTPLLAAHCVCLHIRRQLVSWGDRLLRASLHVSLAAHVHYSQGDFSTTSYSFETVLQN